MNDKAPLPTPEWVDTGKVTDRGLDLLGLRNPVQNIVNEYLSGITTITPAVRYLSIRSLIAHAYVLARRPDKWSVFREYAGKVEAAIALGNSIVESGSLGVLGSEKASEILSESPQSITLEALVKQLGINIYAGASDQLGISFSESDSGIPGVSTQRGVPLADSIRPAFESTRIGRHFLSGEAPEDATSDEIMEFGNKLRLDRFEPDELRTLLDILLPERADQQNRLRVLTFTLLLQLSAMLQRVPTEDDVLELAIEGGSSVHPCFRDCLDGWLAFGIRDSLAVAHEYVLQEINCELESHGPVLVPSADIVGALLNREDEQSAALVEIQVLRSGEALSGLTLREVSSRVAALSSAGQRNRSGLTRWTNGLDELQLIRSFQDKTTRAGSLALLPVAWLLASRRIAEGESESLPVQLLSTQGASRVGLKQVVMPLLGAAVRDHRGFLDFTAELALRTVDQHLKIAWSRFGQDPTKLVAVLSSDGSEWTFRKPFYAGRTAPRISQAVGWLRQLGLVDDSGTTAAGDQRLKTFLENAHLEVEIESP